MKLFLGVGAQFRLTAFSASMATQRAHVNPELLKWARETMRVSIEDAEKKIGLPEGRIAQWEDASSEVEPTIIQLRKACNVYKRPMAAFYLPEPITY